MKTRITAVIALALMALSGSWGQEVPPLKRKFTDTLDFNGRKVKAVRNCLVYCAVKILTF